MSIRDQLADEFQNLITHIREHAPDAVINTRLAQSDERAVIVHAQIVASAGLAAGAHGSAEPQEGAAELAENRALVRAIIALGLPDLSDSHIPRLHSVSPSEGTGRVVPFPIQDAAHESDTRAPEDESVPEDVSWTAFWKWAKANGFGDKTALEAAIGRSIDRMSPAEARQLALAVRPT